MLIAVLVVGLVSTFGMNFSVIIPPLAEDVLHSDAAGYGFLMAASGRRLARRGAVARVRRPRRGRRGSRIGAMILGVGEIALGWSTLPSRSRCCSWSRSGSAAILMAATANTTCSWPCPTACAAGS